MKTLLLTLVVVTIVCLDLGYTRKCLNTPLPLIYKTCPIGQDKCIKMTIKKLPSKYDVIRGCTDICPKSSADVVVVCCDTNKCNK
uniref:Beta-cardiotoxin CTX23 n=1 Tax=Ophiophagus hannah TaxID=8665 RepID=3SDC3_OPHHA|nr:RecName: Full=Beta-cardiotoxin CTX23; Flags: Precursor [Ophiophagus hannah]ABB83635.1 cardiotoxin precursor [Ophiophagus hannah]